jgi:hypothetical protein
VKLFFFIFLYEINFIYDAIRSPHLVLILNACKKLLLCVHSYKYFLGEKNYNEIAYVGTFYNQNFLNYCHFSLIFFKSTVLLSFRSWHTFENIYTMATVTPETISTATDATQTQAELVKLDIKDVREDDGDVVDPWNVTSTSDAGINYDKLICNRAMLLPQCYK